MAAAAMLFRSELYMLATLAMLILAGPHIRHRVIPTLTRATTVAAQPLEVTEATDETCCLW